MGVTNICGVGKVRIEVWLAYPSVKWHLCRLSWKRTRLDLSKIYMSLLFDSNLSFIWFKSGSCLKSVISLAQLCFVFAERSSPDFLSCTSLNVICSRLCFTRNVAFKFFNQYVLRNTSICSFFFTRNVAITFFNQYTLLKMSICSFSFTPNPWKPFHLQFSYTPPPPSPSNTIF